MARLIFEKDNGMNIIVREGLPDNMYLEGIITPDMYLAVKLWSRNDIGVVLKNFGFSDNENNIDTVIDCGGGWLGQLEDCTDRDWGLIRHAVRDTLKSISLDSATGEEILELLDNGQVEFEELTVEQRKIVSDYEYLDSVKRINRKIRHGILKVDDKRAITKEIDELPLDCDSIRDWLKNSFGITED